MSCGGCWLLILLLAVALASAPQSDPLQPVNEAVKSLLAWGVDTELLSGKQERELLHKWTSMLPSIKIEPDEPASESASSQQRQNQEQETTLTSVGWSLKRIGSAVTLSRVLLFLGALIVMGAVTFFMVVSYALLGDGFVFVVCLLSMVTTYYFATHLWLSDSEYTRLAGGLLGVITVTLAPFTAFELQSTLRLRPVQETYRDFYAYIKRSYVHLELATIAVGCFVLITVRFPFITMPIAFSVWLMGMDVCLVLFRDSDFNWQRRRDVSLFYGMLVLCLAVHLDVNQLNFGGDFAFWFHLAGILSVSFGLWRRSILDGVDSLIHTLLALGITLLGGHLDRVTLVLFGYMGILTAALNHSPHPFFLWSISTASFFLITYSPRLCTVRVLLGVTYAVAALNERVKALKNNGQVHMAAVYIYHFGLLHELSWRSCALWSCWAVSIDPLLLATLLSGFVVAWSIKSNLFLPVFLLYSLPPMPSSSLLVCCLAVGLQAWRKIFGRGRHFSNIGNGASLKISLFVLLWVIGAATLHPWTQITWLAYYASCFSLLIVLFNIHSNNSLLIRTIVAILIVFYAVLIGSMFLVSVGGLILFATISKAAHGIFRNSLLFPIYLIVAGLGCMFIGVQVEDWYDLLMIQTRRLLGLNNIDELLHACLPFVAWLQVHLAWPTFVFRPLAALLDGALPKQSFIDTQLVTLVGVVVWVLYEGIRRWSWNKLVGRSNRLRPAAQADDQTAKNTTQISGKDRKKQTKRKDKKPAADDE